MCLSISLIHSNAIVVTYIIQRLGRVEIFMEQVTSLSRCSLCLLHTFHWLFLIGARSYHPVKQTDGICEHLSRAFTFRSFTLPQLMEIICI